MSGKVQKHRTKSSEDQADISVAIHADQAANDGYEGYRVFWTIVPISHGLNIFIIQKMNVELGKDNHNLQWPSPL